MKNTVISKKKSTYLNSRNIEQCLNDFNIPLKLSHTVVKTHGKERLEGVTIAKVDERRMAIAGTEEYIPCDTLLLSVGLIPENELSKCAGVELDPVTNGAIVDQNRETSVKGIYACGNVLHVHDLVDFVSEEAEIVGKASAEYIRSEEKNEESVFVEDTATPTHESTLVETKPSEEPKTQPVVKQEPSVMPKEERAAVSTVFDSFTNANEPPREEKTENPFLSEEPSAPVQEKESYYEETPAAPVQDGEEYLPWAEVLSELTKINMPLWGVLHDSEATISGDFVLIKSTNPTLNAFIRTGTNSRDVKQAIFRVTGKKYRLGLNAPKEGAAPGAAPAKARDPLEDLISQAKRMDINVDIKP